MVAYTQLHRSNRRPLGGTLRVLKENKRFTLSFHGDNGQTLRGWSSCNFRNSPDTVLSGFHCRIQQQLPFSSFRLEISNEKGIKFSTWSLHLWLWK
ncbi:hypothetical protein CapIbe_008128 [Capra ibex]